MSFVDAKYCIIKVDYLDNSMTKVNFIDRIGLTLAEEATAHEIVAACALQPPPKLTTPERNPPELCTKFKLYTTSPKIITS
jgi:hypothetical protein